MDFKKLIETRKSVRTFDGRPLSREDLRKLCEAIERITNPWNIPVRFVLLDAKEHGLSSPVIAGEQLYIAAKVPCVPHCEEAYGYSFEQMVLCAWSLGIGTTWIGGTMKRELFERAAAPEPVEIMPIVSPLGYPAKEPTEVDRKLRASVRGDERLPARELFYEGDFSHPIAEPDELLEAVRWAPSAANLQPCRVVRDRSKYHFYEEHPQGYQAKVRWDVQRILDCRPSLGMLVINALSAADQVLIPVQADYLAAEGLTELIGTVQSIKRQINPTLTVGGVFCTMANETNFRKDIVQSVKDTYGKVMPVFDAVIPATVRLAEISTANKSIYLHDPKGKAAEAYRQLTQEVMRNGNS